MAFQNIAGRLVDVIFGYDIFVSYTWADGSKYAHSLYEKLKTQGFTVFLDEEEYARGDNWTLLGRRALKKTRQLVLIATPRVHESAPVLKELIAFQSTGRRIIPIEVGDSLNPQKYPESPLLPFIPAELLKIKQPLQQGAIPNEAPPEVVRDLRRGFQHVRQAQIRVRVLLGACLVLLGVSSVALWQGYLALANAKEAIAQRQEVQLAFSKADYSEALQRESNDQNAEAVAYLCRALRTNPKNHDAAALLFSVLSTQNRIIPQDRFQPDGEDFMAFDANGRRALTATDKMLRVWDINARRVIREVPIPSPFSRCLAFTPDGRHVIMVNSDRVQSLEIDTGTVSTIGNSGPAISKPAGRDLEIDTETVSTIRNSGLAFIQFSPDGKEIALRDANETRSWNLADNQPVGDAIKQRMEGESPAVSLDGTHILLPSSGGEVMLWNSAGQLVTRKFESHQPPATPSRYIPGPARPDPLYVWDVATGEPVSAPLPYRNSQVKVAAFSPGGESVMTATDDDTVRIWDTATGQPRTRPMECHSEIVAAAWSPDERSILTVSGAAVCIWNAGTGKLVASPLHAPDDVLDAWFSPDGNRIIAAVIAKSGVDLSKQPGPFGYNLNPSRASKVSNYSIKTVFLWDAAIVIPAVETLRPPTWALGAKYSPDGRWIATISGNAAQIWDTSTQVLRTSLTMDYVPVCTVFSADSQRLLLVDEDETARVWNPATGEAISPPIHDEAEITRGSVVSLGGLPIHPIQKIYGAFSPDGKSVAVATGFGARIWDAVTGQPITKPMRHDSYVSSVTFSPDGRRLLTSSKDAYARVWDVATQQPIGQPIHPNAQIEAQIETAAFSPNGEYVVTAANDHSTQIWNALTGRAVSPSIMQQEVVKSVEFSLDSKRVVTMSGAAARVWNAVTGEAISAPMNHSAPLTSVLFSPDGNFVLTASEDQSARIWDATTGLPVSVPMLHAAAVNSASFSADGQFVVTAGEEGIVKIWPFYSATPPSWILDLAELLTGCSVDRSGNPSYLPGKTIAWLRQQASQEPEKTDPMVVWARKILKVDK